MGEGLLGIDVGGTAIKIAIVSQNGEIVSKWEIPTNTSDAGKHIVKDISVSIDSKLQELGETKSNFKGIGIGAPGFIHARTGFIYEAINIGWKNFDLKSQLKDAINLPVIVENDANIAALGEMWKGAGYGCKDLVCITLGTGVGGGVIVNGEIVHGSNGMAGEIGHITVIDNDYPCNCGKKGCLETVASATGIVMLAMKDLTKHPESILYKNYSDYGFITAKMVVEGVRDGDDFAAEIFDKACYYLGLAIANIATTINPSKIVLGGGVSKAGDLLLNSVSLYFKQFSLPRIYEATDLAIASLGNIAGVIGGAWLVKNNL